MDTFRRGFLARLCDVTKGETYESVEAALAQACPMLRGVGYVSAEILDDGEAVIMDNRAVSARCGGGAVENALSAAVAKCLKALTG